MLTAHSVQEIANKFEAAFQNRPVTIDGSETDLFYASFIRPLLKDPIIFEFESKGSWLLFGAQFDFMISALKFITTEVYDTYISPTGLTGDIELAHSLDVSKSYRGFRFQVDFSSFEKDLDAKPEEIFAMVGSFVYALNRIREDAPESLPEAVDYIYREDSSLSRDGLTNSIVSEKFGMMVRGDLHEFEYSISHPIMLRIAKLLNPNIPHTSVFSG